MKFPALVLHDEDSMTYRRALPGGYEIEMHLTRYPFAEGDEADVSLSVHPEGKSLEVWDKEGTATGPGGTIAYTAALKGLEVLEREAVKRWGRITLCVDAATPALYRIYRRTLGPWGYIPHFVVEDGDPRYILNKEVGF